ncbi:MAG TPA: NAD(P)/FAD-dependent oxidoreductase, partial [Actinomycetota bacterium]|nr:NAD(P)/FAD-dependent oxidoreductase [Actinomycetota bacterium]
IVGTHASPYHPGTGWIMAYHQLGGEINGADGTWAHVKGGMGSVTRCLAATATDWGARIRTGAEVGGLILEAGGVSGVRLADGEELRAPVVLSNADPKRTFLSLLPEGVLDGGFEERVRSWRMDGAAFKVNLALGELPRYTAGPPAGPGGGPQHRGTLEIAPSLGYLHRAWEEAAGGAMPTQPFMEVFIQTTLDPTLAVPGCHVASAFVQYAPVGRDLGTDGDEAGARDEALQAVLRTLGAHAPNLPGAVLGSQVLLPGDLERRFGLTGGDIFHGSMLPEQAFGARFAYRTPVPGLYLCGSGASPGGCVMGAAGRNAARVVLGDAGKGSY